jgi:hypothetical protein
MSLPRNDSTAAIKSLAMYAGDSGGEEEDDMPISGSDDEALSPPKRTRLDTDESSQDSRPGSAARFERSYKPTKSKPGILNELICSTILEQSQNSSRHHFIRL